MDMRKGQNPGLYGDCGGWDKTGVRMKVRKISELGSCVKVEMAVLGSPSLIVRMVSMDVKQH